MLATLHRRYNMSNYRFDFSFLKCPVKHTHEILAVTCRKRNIFCPCVCTVDKRLDATAASVRKRFSFSVNSYFKDVLARSICPDILVLKENKTFLTSLSYILNLNCATRCVCIKRAKLQWNKVSKWYMGKGKQSNGEVFTFVFAESEETSSVS